MKDFEPVQRKLDIGMRVESLTWMSRTPGSAGIKGDRISGL